VCRIANEFDREPKNARFKRALEKKEPLVNENPKIALLLRGEKCSHIAQLALADLNALKNPLTLRFSKKNSVRPFEDASSLEFFSDKNDCSLIILGSHSKKRPHCLTVARCFDYKILDMLELYIDPDTFRTIEQFKSSRGAAIGLKPLIAFSGTPFDSPTPNNYTMAKSILTDLFHGQDAASVDVEGLQYLIQFTAGEQVDGSPPPKIHMRVYRIITKRSGQKLPRVEVEELGPRMDFTVGRTKEADETMMREALKRPKQLEPKTKKNITTDLIGDKIGRIHVGKQDLSTLQTRKMKGLKRHLDVADSSGGEDEVPAKIAKSE
jgi:ribosome production factor 2